MRNDLPYHIHDSLFHPAITNKMSEHYSLLSLENSKMNTPFKPISKFESINQLFPHHSETKKASKNLFQALTQIESPKFTPVMAHAYSTRDPYTD